MIALAHSFVGQPDPTQARIGDRLVVDDMKYTVMHRRYVLDAVAAHFETTRWELISERTHRVARRVAMYLALRVTTLSIAQIASRVGSISWKNLVVGARTIEQRVAGDSKFAAEVEGIKASLLAG